MNKLTITIAVFVGLILLQSCKEDDPYATYEHPNWQEEVSSEYSVNMTVILSLPNNLEPYKSENDEMAVFIDDKCRGVATIVDGRFFVSVKGSPDEISSFVVRYYSELNKYKYESVSEIAFAPNSILGTIDMPEQLDFYTLK